MNIRKPPLGFALTNDKGNVSSGWIDWFRSIFRAIGGAYDFGTGYAADNKCVKINQIVVNSETTYTVPVEVKDGALIVISFDSGDVSIDESYEMVRNNVINLPATSPSYYVVTGVLMRSE